VAGAASGGGGRATVDDVVRRLRQRGHRITPQRVAVIREFLGSADHPSAEAVYRVVLLGYPMMAVSTVYSTLRLLVSLGVAAEVGLCANEARYDPNTTNHCHLVCKSCEAIIDVPMGEELLGVVPTGAVAEQSFGAERVMLEVIGLCAACRASGAP
jgi:Fur family transcriptional regulator, peroxide stress response regulator